MQSLYEFDKPAFWSEFLDIDPAIVASAADHVDRQYTLAHADTVPSMPVLRLPAKCPSLRVVEKPAAVLLWDDEEKKVVGVIVTSQEDKPKITNKIPAIELEGEDITEKRNIVAA